jgi:hypothetical protein
MGFLKGIIIQTDIYIDRYLPVKILNMIKEAVEESFADYNDRK